VLLEHAVPFKAEPGGMDDSRDVVHGNDRLQPAEVEEIKKVIDGIGGDRHRILGVPVLFGGKAVERALHARAHMGEV